ncbi:MAG: ATP-binding cassette domain-containing protein [Microbacterium sp.]|jgi:ABC-type lipoprotein export system ATPase subunit|uniref:ATP-binding cassette domain-containing protein n=1 Tax=Microbacterium sp. TaxID=51671 RepID=UPI00281D330E|nr:ATP-binding cassette domain-containing protein [Microbacterium sp.]MDR2322186.1 ATP-binding cassette domain-containing protein [Microbacterium sp.]
MRLSARGVSHAFKGREPLFIDVSFSVDAGKLVGLIGPSGSGKSTMLSMLGGFLKPQAGEVLRESVHSIGWVFQNPVGPPRRSALDVVSYPYLLRGSSRADADSAATMLMGRFGLDGRERNAFRDLSGGEAQRLLLARAVACEYDAILIDEPTAQLDPRSARNVIDVIEEVAGPERVTIVATHDPRLISQCAEVIDLGDV